MFLYHRVILFIFFLSSWIIHDVHAFTIRSLFFGDPHQITKRELDQEILDRIEQVGYLNFSTTVVETAKERRRIACFFVFDKEASNDLNNNIVIAQRYADILTSLASQYTAHANIVITNAGTEIWSKGDQISFTVSPGASSSMPDYLTQFQGYLEKTQKSKFGKTYAIGVLLSDKESVGGGYSQGPPCTTYGASLIRYRPIPWRIAGLLAHELAHTLSVVHPSELPYVCADFPALKFCDSSSLPAECTCSSSEYPPEECLMTFSFGRAIDDAPRYTSCDIEMMRYFSSNISCLARKTRPSQQRQQ